MSSKARRVKKELVQQRITTVLQVLSIMQTEAEKMSWWQRFRLANSFLWKKNIDAFFQVASSNKEADNGREVQDSGKES